MFSPKEEGHHCDGSGKGPADVWIIREGHEMIHDDVGRYAMEIEGNTKRFRGFYGDLTTLKLGNSYYNPGYELNLGNLSTDMFDYKSKNSWELNTNNVTPDIFTNSYNNSFDYNSWSPPKIDYGSSYSMPETKAYVPNIKETIPGFNPPGNFWMTSNVGF